MASKVLAITVGNDYTKISELMFSSHKIANVYFSTTIPTPKDCVEDGYIKDTNALADAIKGVIYDRGILTKDVIFTIQSNKVISKEVVAPFMKENRILDYINTNATEYFPVNIDEYVFTYSILETILDDADKKYRLMVMAAPVNMVERYYDVASRLELRMLGVDYVGNSTLQLIKLQIDESPTLVIQMGDDATIISILSNNVLQLMRSVPYGRATVANAVSEKREIPYEQAMKVIENERVLKESFADGDYITDSLKYLVNNISRVLDYYTSKHQSNAVEKAIIITEGKSIRAIETLLSYEVGIKINKIEELNQVIAEPSLNMPLSELTSYLSNIGCVIKPVNFVPKSANDKVRRTSDTMITKIVIIATIAIIAALVAIPLVANIAKRTKNKNIKEDIDNAKSIEQIVNDYYQAKDKHTDLSSFTILTNSPDDYLMDFIEFLEENMPSDIALNQLSVSEGAVTMACTGSSKETFAQFIVLLKQQSNITGVSSKMISESQDENDVITASYTITCNFDKFPETKDDESKEDTTKEAE